MKKNGLIVFLVIIVILAVGFIYRIYNNSKLDRYGVYVIGIMIKQTESGKRSGSNFYAYKYKNKDYKMSITNSLKYYNDSLVVLRLYPEDPEICRLEYNIKVPYCLNILSVPEEGWKVFPVDTCK